MLIKTICLRKVPMVSSTFLLLYSCNLRGYNKRLNLTQETKQMIKFTRDALSGFFQHQRNILILVTVFRNAVTKINLYCNLALLMSFWSRGLPTQHLKNTTKHLLH